MAEHHHHPSPFHAPWQGDSPVPAVSLACVLFLLSSQLDLMMATLNSSSPWMSLLPWGKGQPRAKCGECASTLEPLDAPARAQVRFFHLFCLAHTWNSWEMVKIAVMPWARLGARYPRGSRR